MKANPGGNVTARAAAKRLHLSRIIHDERCIRLDRGEQGHKGDDARKHASVFEHVDNGEAKGVLDR